MKKIISAFLLLMTAVTLHATVLDDVFDKVKSIPGVMTVAIPDEKCAEQTLDNGVVVLAQEPSAEQIRTFKDLLSEIPDDLVVVDVSETDAAVRIYATQLDGDKAQLLIAVLADDDSDGDSAIVAVLCSGDNGLTERLKVDGSSINFK